MAINHQLLNEMLSGLSQTRNEIWVADDNADVHFLLKKGFRRSFPPVTVEFFLDGKQLVERVRQTQAAPRVLLLDYDMPGLNGVAAVNTLRVEGRLENTVVVMFSTSANDATVAEAYGSGIALFLAKPRDGHEYVTLANLCAHCLEHGQSITGQQEFRTICSVTSAFERLMQKRDATHHGDPALSMGQMEPA